MKGILSQARGVVLVLLYFINTVFWAIPIYIAAMIKLLVPIKPFRKVCDVLLNWFANNWIAVNNFVQGTFCNTRWHVFGLENLKRKEWYLVVANHQSWVDILVLQKVFYRKIPFLKFFLKQELFWIPILGQAWWALDYPFMKRYSSGFIKKHPHLKGKDLEITKRACEKFKNIPVTVMNFVEGTRYTREKHQQQQSPYDNLLKPRAGGIAYVLGAMGQHLNSFLDVTIAYPQGPQSFWNYLCGKVTDIRVQVRAVPITEDMLGDYFNNEQFREAFQEWMNVLWQQKSQCIKELIAAPLIEAESSAPVIQPKFHEPIPVLKFFETPILPDKSTAIV